MPDYPSNYPSNARSFDSDGQAVTSAPGGQRAHTDALTHGELFTERLWACGPHAWSLVGNGLSNQCFIDAPEGLIAIDTGESVEEMAAALKALRQVTQRPVVAVIYTHFHYVGGTSALADDVGSRWPDLPIWAHAGVAANRLRTAGEFSPAAERGLVHQFGLLLPPDGEDGLLNVGLGPSFRNPAHAPYTPGHRPATHTVEVPTETTIAGLKVLLHPAPSDSNDSLTLWFPEIGVCINNLLWPCLFNVYPIRGEAYRDPTVLLAGLDHLLTLPIDHLLGAHGPPLQGRAAVAQAVTIYRDAIQYMWDQTVRGLNQGLTGPEIAHRVPLPAHWQDHHFTRQAYGLMEHHLRQIRNGLVGWFDGDESTLFALPTAERAARMLRGFGGRDQVRRQAEAALADNDLRWALELGSWLVRATPDEGQAAAEPGDAASGDVLGDAPEADADLMARVLRAIAQRTPAQNLRNWCLTRALELTGRIDLARFRRHRFRMAELLANPPATFVPVLRVLLVPERAAGLNDTLAWQFDDGTRAGLALRHQVAVPFDGVDAAHCLHLSGATWAALLAGRLRLSDALSAGDVRIEGDAAQARRLLACFDLDSLGS
jgi:alkyl sulfatase BDS1-like metallo-beta-lactamase superfamily hydrolase